MTFAATAILVIAAFFILGALRIHPLLSFVILSAVLILVNSGVSALAELFLGVGARVAVSRQPVRAGETFKVRCEVTRQRSGQELTVTWQGREEAVLRGYDNTRFEEAFFRHELSHALGETVSIDVPPDAMPSFTSRNARIIWSICVEAQIPGGTMVSDFPILVLPGRA